NANFGVTNFDDGLLEGPQVTTIVATAPGFAEGSDTVTNLDRQAVLSLTLPASVSEINGWITGGQIHAVPQVDANVTVHLTSSDPSRLQVPDFVVLPAGQNSVGFGFAAIDDNLINGNQQITITATVTGWISGQGQTLVVDNETTNLFLS